MRIEFIQKCSDFDGPVLDIYLSSIEDAFKVGVVFEKIVNKGKCVWRGGGFIRIPLVDMDEIGLALQPEMYQLLKNLHTHPDLEEESRVAENHVIIDRGYYERLKSYVLKSNKEEKF